MKQLFQCAVLLHSYDNEGDYVDSSIVIAPKWVLATTRDKAEFQMIREIPEEFAQKDGLEILIAGF